MPNFSLAEGRKVVGDYAVYPNSLLFRAGDYPDKDFIMSAADIAASAASFVPVDFNVEHAKHGAHQALSGAFGGILKTWADPNSPNDLRGEVAVPLWLDTRLETKSPSLEFDKATKRITGAALTYTPRVSDAALMSAVAEFANTRHNTPEGQMVIQDMHDTAARAGAVCDKKNAGMTQNAEMSSQHEATAIQKIHDMAADHGATCSKGDAPAWAKSMSFSIHHPKEAVLPFDTKHTGEKPMSEKAPWYARLIPSLKTAGASEEDIHATFSELPTAQSGMTPAEKAEFGSTRAELARMKADGLQKDAKSFVLGLMQSGQSAPYEAADLIAAFCQAAADDAALSGTVNFSAIEEGKPVTKQGTRLDALKARESRRPSSGLTREMAGDKRALMQDDFTAMFARNSQGETAEDRESRQSALATAELAKHGIKS